MLLLEPGMRLFLTAFAVAFVLLSALAAPRQRERSMVGTVARVEREWMSVINEQTDPGFRLALRDTAFYGPTGHRLDLSSITPGVRVRVSYRSVSERMLLADRVEVLSPPASR